MKDKQGMELADYIKMKDDETKDIKSHTGGYMSEFETLGAIMFNKHHDELTWCKLGHDEDCPPSILAEDAAVIQVCV